MSVVRTQDEVDSVEFAEWRAFYRLYDQQQTGDEAEPDIDELSAKIHGWASSQKRQHGEIRRER